MGFRAALQYLGFSAPFAYAAAMYGLCFFLDKNASPQAKKAMSSWLQSGAYTGKHVSTLAVLIFDRVFTHPLFSLRTILRSAIFTLIVMGLVIYARFPMIFPIYFEVP